MKLKRKMNNPTDQEFWDYIDSTVKEVDNYPSWMRGGESSPKNGNGNGNGKKPKSTKETDPPNIMNFS